MSKWYIEKGDQGDVVLSTRVRLARNLNEHPFPSRLDAKGRQTVNELVRDALMKDNTGDFRYVVMKDLTRAQAVSLA